MRTRVLLLVALSLQACTGQSPPLLTEQHRLAPPVPRVTAGAFVTSNGGDALVLEVTALLRNATKVHFQVADPAYCPLFVRLFPNPTGEPAGALDGSMQCPSGTPTFDLAPGDSALLTRVLGAGELVAFAPGKYGINVAVTTGTGVVGTWAGNIDLPLVARP